MAEQRLPIVDGDDGAWGDILNQYIEKEHYNTGVDNVANGGHKNISIRPGTTAAGTAPLKFTSGPLMSTPEVGAVEFLNDKLYITQTSSTVRKVLAAYDDTSGATGDIYYRDSGANFVRLPLGNSTDFLGITAGIPAWKDISSTYQETSAKNQASGYAGLDSNSYLNPNQLKDWPYAIQSEVDRSCSGLGGASKESNLISVNANYTTLDIGAGFGYVNDHSGNPGTYKRVTFSGGTAVALAGNGANYISINSSGNIEVSLTKADMADHIYLGHAYVVGGFVAEVFNVPEWTGHFQGRVNEFMADGMKTIVSKGLTVQEQVTPLKLTIATGEMYCRLSAIYVNSPITSFTKMYNNNGSWTQDTNNPDFVNTTQWNNTTSGLVVMTDGYWKKDLVILTPSKRVYYMFGQAEYATEDGAKSGAIPAIPDDIRLDSAYLVNIVSQKGDTSIGNRLYDISPNLDRIFGYGTSGGGVIVDHGSLTGLSDDDHSQYHNDARANTWLSGKNTGDLAVTTDKKYVTDAQLVVIGNTSGTNTGDVNDATLTITDVTTNNASTTKHGWFPKLPTATGKYLRDDMSWQTVSATHTPTAMWGDSISAASVQSGTTSYVRVPYSGTITSWSIIATVSCSCTLDVWKANASLPTVANTITASAKPALSSATTASSSTLTGWTTSVSAGDVFGFNLQSLTGSPTAITLVLNVG